MIDINFYFLTYNKKYSNFGSVKWDKSLYRIGLSNEKGKMLDEICEKPVFHGSMEYFISHKII